MANHKIEWQQNIAESDIDDDLYGIYKRNKYVDIVRNITTQTWSVLYLGRKVAADIESRSAAKIWIEENIKLIARE